MTPEGKVKAKVRALLKELDVYFFMPRGSTYGTQGIPDFICCVHGRFAGVETKAGYNKPTAMQREQMRQIELHGGRTFVVNEDIDTLNALKEWIENER